MVEVLMKKKNISKRMMRCLLAVLLIFCGICWQAVSVNRDKKIHLPIGEYVDTGTYSAHYYARGAGEIAFVFITGSGTPNAYTDFYRLQQELSHKGTTITFDHAGSGWSKKAESERSIENLVKELNIIIDTAAPQKPVVLICHSLGY